MAGGFDGVGSGAGSWDSFASWASGDSGASVSGSSKGSSSASANGGGKSSSSASASGGGKSSSSASASASDSYDVGWASNWGGGGDAGGGSTPSYAPPSSGNSGIDAVGRGIGNGSNSSGSWDHFQAFVDYDDRASNPPSRSDPVGPGASWEALSTFANAAATAASRAEEKDGNFFTDMLDRDNDYRDSRQAERAAAGVTPSDGFVNWNAIMHDLNTPYTDRVAAGGAPADGVVAFEAMLNDLNAPAEARNVAAGGKAFEGALDTEGIMDAIFGGPSVSTRDNQSFLANNVPTPDYALPTMGSIDKSTWGGFQAPAAHQLGLVQDPVTGAQYAPGFAPDTAWAKEQTASLKGSPIAALEGLPASVVNNMGVPATGSRDAPVSFATGPTAPSHIPSRPGSMVAGVPAAQTGPATRQVATIPVGPDGMPLAAPAAPAAQVQPAAYQPAIGGRGSNAGVTLSATAPEETMMDKIVNGAGTLLGSTAAGGLVQSIFPEFWDDTGQNVKDSLNSIEGKSYSRDDLISMGNWDGSQNGEDDNGFYFVDANGNGIDDRHESTSTPAVSTPPLTIASSAYDRNGDLVFPGIPPYNPGRDPEWLYFRGQELKDGGLVKGYADGGAVASTGGLDPRVTIIADAEEALGGSHPNPEQAIKLFIDTFGEEALAQLKAQVESGMTLKGKPRMVKGPGGPKDDMVPARIDNGQEAKLSNGEFVMTADAVANAGDGDPEKGAAYLSQLDEMLSSKGAGVKG